MSSNELEYLEINPAGPVTHTIVWLHGLGADGHDFEPIVPELGLPSSLGVRFVFPHAAYMPVTINRGYVMRAWYDIVSEDIARHADKAGVDRSTAAVTALVQEEIARGVPAANIVVAGFSQGGVIALEVGARFPEPLAGIVALSTYVADSAGFPAASASSPPVFMAHGRFDGVVQFALGSASRKVLEDKGYRITWRDYAMLHSVCEEEISDIGAWLRAELQASAPGV